MLETAATHFQHRIGCGSVHQSRVARALIPVSDMTIWRWTADSKIGFPEPVKLGADGRNFWWLPAVHDFLRRRSQRPPRRRNPPRHRD